MLSWLNILVVESDDLRTVPSYGYLFEFVGFSFRLPSFIYILFLNL
jgi:hypothetical protein